MKGNGHAKIYVLYMSSMFYLFYVCDIVLCYKVCYFVSFGELKINNNDLYALLKETIIMFPIFH